MVTLKDIAEKANVSMMTVSRVVNGKYSKVSKKTIEKVLKIVEETGYVTNASARSLSSKNSHIISIIMREDGRSLQNPYNATMLGNITQYVQEQNYDIMLHFINDYRDISKRLSTWNIEGAIFLGMFDKEIANIVENTQPSLVFIDSYSPVRQITNVGIDDYKGGVLAAKYFIEHGHKNFVFIGTIIADSPVTQQRLKGFKDTITKAGLTLKPEHIISYVNPIGLADEILKINDPITAIFTTADIIAIKLIDQMVEKGIQIPEKYSIIGFDNLPLSYYITPKLTTIEQDIDKKAQIAVKKLFQHIKEPNTPSENTILDLKLIERNSVRTI